MKRAIYKTKTMKLLGPGLMALALMILIALSARGAGQPVPAMRYVDFWQAFLNGQVRQVQIGKEHLDIVLSDGSQARTSNPQSESLRETLLLGGVEIAPVGYALDSRLLMQTGCLLMLISGIIFTIKDQKQTKVCQKQTEVYEKPTETNFGFSRVAGQDEAVESLRSIVSYMTDQTRYHKIGARMPHGILFYGPPGTGKTLLARAVAEEAGVPFLHANGSDFVQMYVGVGAKRIRELFAKARKNQRCIIFIDEIDAIGRRRSDGQDAERDQTLNALLTEMSGFDQQDQILVLAATNRPDMLDSALTRPGRFDRRIEVSMPDKTGRSAILQVLSRGKQVEEEVDFEKIADQTVGFSGAGLENLLNEAALYAVRAQRAAIGSEDIDRAIRTVLAGEEKTHYDADARQRDVCAVHEAGHAVAARMLFPNERIHAVSIVPTTRGAAGYVLRTPSEGLLTREYYQREVMLAYAGRAAEQFVFGRDAVTQGASNDIEKATELLKTMACKFGMLLTDAPLGRNAGDQQADAAIRDEARTLYEKTMTLVEVCAPLLYEIRNQLMEYNRLDEAQLDELFAKFSPH